MSTQVNALETRLSGIKKELDEMEPRSASFTPEEAKAFNAKVAEGEDVHAQLVAEKNAEKLRIAKAADKLNANKQTAEEKVATKFSFQRAINGLVRGKVDGVEAEMSQEAEHEMRQAGMANGIQGVGIPGFMLSFKGSNVHNGHQKRDLSSGGTATGAEYVQTLEIGHQFGLEVAPKALSMGVELLAGLTGNVYITQTGSATAVWEGENDANAETTPATSKPVNLSPKRLGAFTDISKTLLTQTSGVAESRVRQQLSRALARELDQTIFIGSGSGEPTGVSNTSNINTHSIGGAPGREDFLTMWALIAADNADLGSLGIVTTAAIEAYLRNAPIDAGSGRFVWEDGRVIGYNAIYSNHITTGMILMGVWNQFVVGQWGGVDLVVNPYTRAKENILEVVVNTNWDMGCYYPQAFVKVTDVTL